MRSPMTSMRTSSPVSGKAISKAVRNWLETPPLTSTAEPGHAAAGKISKGGKPFMAEIAKLRAHLA